MRLKTILSSLLLLLALGRAQERTPTVAVLDFEALAVTLTEAKTLTDKLRAELLKTGKFTIIERGQMNDILEEQKFQMSGCTSQECAVEVGQLLGAEQIMLGGVGKVGEMYLVSLRSIDVESGRVLKNVTEEMSGKLSDLLVYGIINVARKIAGLPPIAGYVRAGAPRAAPGPIAGGFGDLHITSDPSGGEIYLNDALYEGKTTPASIQELPAGAYTVKVVNGELIGSQDITLKKDDLLKINIALKRGKGSLKLFSSPDGAEVFLDGQSAGRTPLMLRDIPAGRHAVECRLPGHLDFSKNVDIDIGQTLKRTCVLDKGTLLKVSAHFEGAHLGASVSINGEARGTAPFSAMVPFGEYRIKLAHPGYNDVEETVQTGERPELSLSYGMKHTAEYLRLREEEKRLRAEQAERLRQEQARQQAEAARLERGRAEREAKIREENARRAKTALKWTVRVASGIGALALAGVTYYNYTKAVEAVEELDEIENDYKNASMGFDEYAISHQARRDDAMNYRNSIFLMMGLAAGSGLVCGITFAF